MVHPTYPVRCSETILPSLEGGTQKNGFAVERFNAIGLPGGCLGPAQDYSAADLVPSGEKLIRWSSSNNRAATEKPRWKRAFLIWRNASKLSG